MELSFVLNSVKFSLRFHLPKLIGTYFSGVVRGIDLENDYLVLITQARPEVLEETSYLVLNSISLPPSVYMTPQNIRGLMPYVMEGELTSLAQLTKRSYLPAFHTSLK